MSLAITKAIESLALQAAYKPVTFMLTNECGSAILEALRPTPSTDAEVVKRDLVLLLEGEWKNVEIDDHCGLPLGHQLEALADRILAVTEARPSEGSDGLPADIVELVRRIGRAEWGQTSAHDADGHADHVRESVKITAETFGQTEPQHMHGLYVEGAETVICHTGTSPNSPQIARALTGAWNKLHDLTALSAASPARPVKCPKCNGTGYMGVLDCDCDFGMVPARPVEPADPTRCSHAWHSFPAPNSWGAQCPSCEERVVEPAVSAEREARMIEAAQSPLFDAARAVQAAAHKMYWAAREQNIEAIKAAMAEYEKVVGLDFSAPDVQLSSSATKADSAEREAEECRLELEAITWLAETRIKGGDEMGPRVWRIALEDIARAGRRALSKTTTTIGAFMSKHHWRNGVTFERQGDGSVKIEGVNPPLVIPANEWASVVASVSHDSSQFNEAVKLHG